MFLKLLVEKRCAKCRLRLLDYTFNQPFIFPGIDSLSIDSLSIDSLNESRFCSCPTVEKTFFVASANTRVFQSIALLAISLVMTATLIVIRNSPTLNADSNHVLLGYELSINDVNRFQNYQNYESYLSKQFSADGFRLNTMGGVNSNGLHSIRLSNSSSSGSSGQ